MDTVEFDRDTFVVHIDRDDRTGEFRAIFANADYPVILAAASETALRERVTNLISRYLHGGTASVLFCNRHRPEPTRAA